MADFPSWLVLGYFIFELGESRHAHRYTTLASQASARLGLEPLGRLDDVHPAVVVVPVVEEGENLFWWSIDGDATMLPFDDNAFDAVVAASVINVVADAESVLSEMHRVCAPGGTVSVLVPSTGFTDGDLDVLIDTLGLTGFSRAPLRSGTGAPRRRASHASRPCFTASTSDRLSPVGISTGCSSRQPQRPDQTEAWRQPARVCRETDHSRECQAAQMA